MEEPSGLETLSSSRRFKLGAGSLFILHMAVCRWLRMPWQTFIQPQSHEHSCMGAGSQKCRNICTLQDATHLSNQMGRTGVRTGRRRLMMRISQRTNVNSQSCPIVANANKYTANCVCFASGRPAFRDLSPQTTHLAHRRVRRGRPIFSFRKYITLGRCQQGAKIGSAEKKKRRPGSGLLGPTVKLRHSQAKSTHITNSSPRAHRVSASRHGLLLRENLFLHKPPQWFNRAPRHNLRHA